MSPKLQRIFYYLFTALLTALMAFSVNMYFSNTENVKGYFESMGFPAWLVIPLAIVKILGIVAIWTRLSKFLKEWAYAGFFFDFTLAFFAHYFTDGGYLFSIFGLVFLAGSYYFDGKLHGNAGFNTD